MDKETMKQRTKQFALRNIRLIQTLPPGQVSDVLSKQLLRSSTSVGANYRAACRAKSTADFIYKLSIVEEEADESAYWLELLVESGLVKASLLEELMQEADELVAITVATIRSTKQKEPKQSL